MRYPYESKAENALEAAVVQSVTSGRLSMTGMQQCEVESVFASNNVAAELLVAELRASSVNTNERVIT